MRARVVAPLVAAVLGIGCGIATDHLTRSGVIGNGARPRCGMPASFATLATAMLDGEPLRLFRPRVTADAGTRAPAGEVLSVVNLRNRLHSVAHVRQRCLRGHKHEMRPLQRFQGER